MEGSRLRILNLLLHRKQATVDQLSQEMGLASATVRRHLDILQRDNLVSFQQVKKKTGRPEHAYFLTEAGQEFLPKGYNQLLGRLLANLSGLSSSEVSNVSGHDLLRGLFKNMAEESAAADGDNHGASFDERVAKALAVLRSEQFQPEIEEEPGFLRLRLHNCPFRSVAMTNASICAYDEYLLSSIFGAEVTRANCIRGGDQGCCYVVPSTR